MTISEAQSVLHCPDTVGGLYSEKYGEALSMAMEALKREPCEDCISRDMALEKMADYVASGYADSAEDFEEYSKIICQLPSVTPARARGKWIYLNAQEETYGGWYQCSVCHGASYEENFCPNCGAEMEVEE